MKRSVIAILLLGAILLVSAQEIPLRKAWKVDFSGSHVRTTEDCVITLWEDTDAGDTDIYAQKINASGMEQWPQAIILAGGPGAQEIMACESTSDHNFVFIYRSSGPDIQPGLYIQKVTSQAQLLWGENGVQLCSDYHYSDLHSRISLFANQVGGVYVVYNHFPAFRTLLGQNLDSFGNQLWPAGGIVLASHNNGVMYIDGVVSDGQGGFILNVTKQVGTNPISELTRISAQGTVIGNNPMLAPEAFPGSRYSILQDSSGDYVLWNVRFAATTDLVLHRMDNLGNLLMSSPQVTSLNVMDDSCNPPCLHTLADGGLMLSYKYNSLEEKQLMLVRFDSSYALLWDHPVVLIANAEQAFSGQAKLSVTAAGWAWLVWIQVNTYSGEKELKAQYISPSGMAAWGNSGMSVSGSSHDILHPLSLAIADKGFFFWLGKIGNQVAVRRQVMNSIGVCALDAGGTPMVSRLAGIAVLLDVVATEDKYLVFWADSRNGPENIYYQLCDVAMNPLLEPEGRPLCPEGNWYVDQISSQGMPDGKVAVFAYSPSHNASNAQRISTQGTRLWTDAGIQLPFQAYRISDVFGGEALTLLYQTSLTLSELRLQKMAGDGSLLYGNEGHLIAEGLQYNFDAQLIKFANGSMGCTWSDSFSSYGYRDVFVRYINPQGMALGDGPELLCEAWLEQSGIRTAVIGNSAMVAWTDARAGILNSENYINAIYATLIDAIPTGISDPVLLAPATAVLRQNYPNPFNPDTIIAFELPESGTASLKVYNTKGQLVRQLHANQLLAAGNHTVVWDGCDEQGRCVGSGIYLYRLSFRDQSVSRKMLLAK